METTVYPYRNTRSKRNHIKVVEISCKMMKTECCKFASLPVVRNPFSAKFPIFRFDIRLIQASMQHSSVQIQLSQAPFATIKF